jgi:cytidylate kinase
MPRDERKKGKKPNFSVIISGMPSVGKTTAANYIAKKFGLRHLAGGDMLKQIAREQGFKPSGADWWDTNEGMRFLSMRKKNRLFDKEVDKRLIKQIRRGGVVVTSYPIPWICKEGLKMWFAASRKTRAKRLAGRDSISVKKAFGIVKNRDSANMKLYRDLYGIEFGKDLSVFNFRLDTENLTANKVAKMAAGLVESYAESMTAREK